MVDAIGPLAMGMAQIFSVLIHTSLWVGVAALSVRVRRERARRLLVAAGLTGAVLAVLRPAFHVAVSSLITSTLQIDLMQVAFALLTVVSTMVSLVPWGLLLGGLWRAGAPDEPET